MADWVAISSLATAGGTLALAATTYALSGRRTAPPGRRRCRSSPGSGRCSSSRRARTRRSASNFVDGVSVTARARAPASRSSRARLPRRLVAQRRAGHRACCTAATCSPSGASWWRARAAGRVPSPHARHLHPARQDRLLADRLPGRRPASGTEVLAAVERGVFSVHVLYGDYEGGQRVVSHFGVRREEDGTWPLTVVRHWQIDRDDPVPLDRTPRREPQLLGIGRRLEPHSSPVANPVCARQLAHPFADGSRLGRRQVRALSVEALVRGARAPASRAPAPRGSAPSCPASDGGGSPRRPSRRRRAPRGRPRRAAPACRSARAGSAPCRRRP